LPMGGKKKNAGASNRQRHAGISSHRGNPSHPAYSSKSGGVVDPDTNFCRETNEEGSSNDDYNALANLKLRMWDFEQCDPKRCTGARLARRGIFKTMPLRQPFRGIVLSPNGTTSVSPSDLHILEGSGLSVIGNPKLLRDQRIKVAYRKPDPLKLIRVPCFIGDI